MFIQVSNRCERWLRAQAGRTGKDWIIIDQDSFISLQNPLPVSTLDTVQSNLLGSFKVVHQAPVHGIFQTRYCSRLLFPASGDLPYPGIKLSSPVSPALGSRFFTTGPPGKPVCVCSCVCKNLLF